MEGKKIFNLYTDLIKLVNGSNEHNVEIEPMTDEEAGQLFKWILEYVNDLHPSVPREIRFAVAQVKKQLDEDLEKYKEKCRKNKENIQKRWDTKDNKHIPNDTNVYERIPSDTKNTDKDKDKDKDKDIYNNTLSKDNDINSRSDNQKLSNSIVYKLIFDTWNQQDNLIQHKELTKVRIEAIKKALKNYEPNIIVQAIKNYSEVLKSNYRFTYKWDLETFLKQSNAMPQFTDEGSVWNNYLQEASKNAAIMPQESRETPDCFKDFFGKIK